MKRLWRLLKRGLFSVVVLLALLLAPVVYVETTCQGARSDSAFVSALPPEHHRAATNTLLTYPEWHIVHAYDDYAKVISTQNPHDYRFLEAIGGFWSSLCTLSKQAAQLGPVDGQIKQMVYVIGVSFTAELGMKAAYEETIGRLATWLRGPTLAELDHVTAQQATAYATFLQQTPWYLWPFLEDIQTLNATADSGLRNTERRLAVGLEYRAKAAYAKLIEQAVASTGQAALRVQMVVTPNGVELERFEGVRKITDTDQGTIIETPRYRILTHLLAEMAQEGVEFHDIAGNDQIMLTVLSDTPADGTPLLTLPRQGHGDFRSLILVPVSELASVLNDLPRSGQRLEHIHDY